MSRFWSRERIIYTDSIYESSGDKVNNFLKKVRVLFQMKTLEMSREKLTCQAESLLVITSILAQTNITPETHPQTHAINILDKLKNKHC